MLHKIIYKNFKSNIRKYILFFASNIIAVAELFIFCSIYSYISFYCYILGTDRIYDSDSSRNHNGSYFYFIWL